MAIAAVRVRVPLRAHFISLSSFNMKVQYHTSGTCSRLIDIDFDPETHIVNGVSFEGGCNGNLQGIGRLVAGMKVEDVIERLKGIHCGNKHTSCPDQLACALEQMCMD